MISSRDDVARSAETGVYAISIVSELTGIEPHTLRGYERAGLLTPARTAGGTRLYSDTDVATAQHVHALAGGGINFNGIHHVLALEAENRRLRDEIARLHQTSTENTRRHTKNS